MVEPTPFEDRAAGLAVIDQRILDVVQLPDIGQLQGGNPKWRHRDPAAQTELTLRTFERLANREPKRMAAAIVKGCNP